MKFGNYETTTEIARVDGITVYRARNDVSESFVIKVFSIPHFAGKDEQKVKEFNELFYSRVEAHKKAALNSQHIVPILQFGVREEIAWYVTNYYPTNLEKLLAAKLSLDRQQFFEIVHAVVRGALDFKRYCGRAHGNLKLPNVLLTGDIKHKIGKAMLTDPPPGDSATPTAMELADLKFIGELMYRLVYPHETRMIDLRKLPIMPTSQKWVAMFGDHSRDWFELCNRLLDPKIALDKFNLERLEAELQRLRPEPKRAGGNIVWIGAGVAAAIAVVLIVVMTSGKNKPAANTAAASKPVAPKSVSAGPSQAELDAKRLAEEKSRQEANRLAAEQKVREEASRKAEAEAKQRAEESRQLDEQRQQALAAAEKARQEASAKANADEKSRQEADARRLVEEAKAKKLTEEMARIEKAQQEAKVKAASEEKLRIEAEAKRKAEEARTKQLSEDIARLEKARAEAAAQAAEAERLRKESEAKRVAEEAKNKQLAEELARKQREAQEAARQQQAQALAQATKPASAAEVQPTPIIRPQGTKPVSGKKWVNSLDMRFVPVGGDVLFCVWETRRKDYETFVRESRQNLDNNWKTAYFKQDETEPVINVSLAEAQAFCKWLTERERQAGLLGGNQTYRLPSDAEWIQANAQPASDLAYPWGISWPPPAGAGNYATTCSYDGFENTAAVGQFMANANGLFDMGGNAWELCLSGTQLSVRGGSWQTTAAEQLNNAYHQTVANGQRAEDIGFRCVLVTR